MSESNKPPHGSVLQRWSQRKHEAAREKETSADKSADKSAEKFSAPKFSAPPSSAAVAAAPLAPESASRTAPDTAPAHDGPLPPVESLTIDSDFSPFLQPKVDAALKRQALKQLFRDPHFNVMDGLDIYIGDYSQPDPIAPEIVRQMVQGRYIFDPPPTRINAQGFVEDIPEDERAALEGDPPAAALPGPGAEAGDAPALPAPGEGAAAESNSAPGEPAVETRATEAPEEVHPKAQ